MCKNHFCVGRIKIFFAIALVLADPAYCWLLAQQPAAVPPVGPAGPIVEVISAESKDGIVGEVVTISATVRNNRSVEQLVKVTASISGCAKLVSPASQTIRIGAGGTAKVSWQVKIVDVGEYSGQVKADPLGNGR